MLELDSERKERRERLVEFFKSNSQVWHDIESELRYSLRDAQEEAIHINCQRRDYQSGYCGGIKMAIGLRSKIEAWSNK